MPRMNTPSHFPTFYGRKIIVSPQGGIQLRHWHPHPTPSSMQRVQRFLQQSHHEERREGDRIFYISWLEN